MNNRNQETKLVKQALLEAGYKNIRVRHGTGTAYGWLDVYVSDTLPGIEADSKYRHIIKVVQQATGRHGEYDGCININQ